MCATALIDGVSELVWDIVRTVKRKEVDEIKLSNGSVTYSNGAITLTSIDAITERYKELVAFVDDVKHNEIEEIIINNTSESAEQVLQWCNEIQIASSIACVYIPDKRKVIAYSETYDDILKVNHQFLVKQGRVKITDRRRRTISSTNNVPAALQQVVNQRKGDDGPATDEFKAAPSHVTSEFQSDHPPVTKEFKSPLFTVADDLENATPHITTALKNALPLVTKEFKTVPSSGKGAFEPVIDEVKSIPSPVTDKFKSVPSNVTDELKNDNVQISDTSLVSIQTHENRKSKIGVDFDWQRDAQNVECFVTTEGIKVYVYKASIVKLPVDCIVNSANCSLQHGGGVAKVIADAAGHELTREGDAYVIKHGNIPVGKAFTTTAGKLPYHCVIHTVGPCWYDYRPHTLEKVKHCEKDLRSAIVHSFLHAEHQSLKTIAVPSVSAAIFGVPGELCVYQYAQAILAYSRRSTSITDSLSEIHFVDVNPTFVQQIQDMFRAMIQDGKAPDYSSQRFVAKQSVSEQTGLKWKLPTSRSDTCTLQTVSGRGYNTAMTPLNQRDSLTSDKSSLRVHESPRQFDCQRDAKNVKKFKTVVEGIVVYVYQASIVNLPVDCIVNATNDNLIHGGGVAKAIADAAGYELTREGDEYIRQNGKIAVGKACTTTAGRLPYVCVIHAIGPRWSEYSPHTLTDVQQCGKDLYSAISESFKHAERRNLRSIALPAISSAIFGVPEEICAYQYARATLDYCRGSISNQRALREIHFIDIKPDIVNKIQDMFSVMLKDRGQTGYDVLRYVKQSSHRSDTITSELKGSSSKSPNSSDEQMFKGFEIGAHAIKSAIPAIYEERGQHVFLIGGSKEQKLHLCKGNIFNVKASAIVAVVNVNGTGGGRMATEIVERMDVKTKLKYDKEKRTQFLKQTNDVADVLVTNGYASGFRRILHAVLPLDVKYKLLEDRKRLALLTYDNILKVADGIPDVNSVVLSLIGLGGESKDEFNLSADALLDSYTVFCNRKLKNPDSKPLTVILVCKDAEQMSQMFVKLRKHVAAIQPCAETIPPQPQRPLLTKKQQQPFTSKYGKRGEREPMGLAKTQKSTYVPDKRGPEKKYCDLCMEDVRDQSTLDCGHVFCRDCIEPTRKFTQRKACPACAISGNTSGSVIRNTNANQKQSAPPSFNAEGAKQIPFAEKQNELLEIQSLQAQHDSPLVCIPNTSKEQLVVTAADVDKTSTNDKRDTDEGVRMDINMLPNDNKGQSVRPKKTTKQVDTVCEVDCSVESEVFDSQPKITEKSSTVDRLHANSECTTAEQALQQLSPDNTLSSDNTEQSFELRETNANQKTSVSSSFTSEGAEQDSNCEIQYELLKTSQIQAQKDTPLVNVPNTLKEVQTVVLDGTETQESTAKTKPDEEIRIATVTSANMEEDQCFPPEEINEQADNVREGDDLERVAPDFHQAEITEKASLEDSLPTHSDCRAAIRTVTLPNPAEYALSSDNPASISVLDVTASDCSGSIQTTEAATNLQHSSSESSDEDDRSFDNFEVILRFKKRGGYTAKTFKADQGHEALKWRYVFKNKERCDKLSNDLKSMMDATIDNNDSSSVLIETDRKVKAAAFQTCVKDLINRETADLKVEEIQMDAEEADKILKIITVTCPDFASQSVCAFFDKGSVGPTHIYLIAPASLFDVSVDVFRKTRVYMACVAASNATMRKV